MNPDILESFMNKVDGGEILEMGLRATAVDYLKTRFEVESFFAATSRFKYDSNNPVKQNTYIRLPFEKDEFHGLVCHDVLRFVGDGGYFVREMLRVTKGPLLIYESNIDAYPMGFFEQSDDIVIHSVSTNGKLIEIGQVAMDFAVRPDLKRIFYRPGGGLSKFNMLVPEDVKMEVGMLFQRFE